MRALAASALLLAGLSVVPAASKEVRGKCLLVVSGTTYLNGPCNIDLQAGGGFTIGVAKPLTYFGMITDPEGAKAEGFWNEERGANHAHSRLGTLTRNDACWTNDTALMCAWRDR